MNFMPHFHFTFQNNDKQKISIESFTVSRTQKHQNFLNTLKYHDVLESTTTTYFAEMYKVPPEKTKSHLKSQFPPEMTLLKSQ